MKVKLSKNASQDGKSWANAIHNSALVCTELIGGILISIINNVIAMANTPSQKASRRELGFASVIVYFGSYNKQRNLKTSSVLGFHNLNNITISLLNLLQLMLQQGFLLPVMKEV
jgi:hypothetical protein